MGPKSPGEGGERERGAGEGEGQGQGGREGGAELYMFLADSMRRLTKCLVSMWVCIDVDMVLFIPVTVTVIHA